MNKEFVPYELALKLKQLGFDEPCIATYGYLELYINTDDGHLKAPLFQQAFRWFREKYDLHYEIHHVKSIVKRLKYKPKKVTELVEYTYEVDGALIDVVDTYEEAELACLTQLIEIAEAQTK